MTQRRIPEEFITLSRKVGILLPIGATSYSTRVHYVVPKRRDFIAHWRNVIFQKNALRCLETSEFDCPLAQRHVPHASNPQLKRSELALITYADMCQTFVLSCQATRRRISRAPNFTKKCADSCRRQSLAPPTDRYTFSRSSPAQAALILQLSSTVKRIIDFITECLTGR